MVNLLLISSGAIVGIALGCALVFMAGWMWFVYGFLVPMHRRDVMEKQQRKLQEMQVKADIEIQKKNAEQKQKDDAPRFCPYCGARNEGRASQCSACGGSLS